MAWQNAEKIASEMLALVKGCAPHIQHQWAWAGVCNLLKMTAIRWVGLAGYRVRLCARYS